MGWDTVVTDAGIVAIHAALLPTEPDGVVVMYGDWSGGGGPVGVQDLTFTRLHRIGSNAIDVVDVAGLPTTDVFCAGQAFLADGRLLAAGGTLGWANTHAGIHAPHYDGERACWIYLPKAKRWLRAADLNSQPNNDSIGGGRWYPTQVTLENGEVFAAGGHPTDTDDYPASGTKRHNNNTPERYSPGANAWTLMTADITAPYGAAFETDAYPRFHLVPDGLLFSDTAGKDNNGDGSVTKKRFFDPYAGTWVGPDVGGLNVLPDYYNRGSAATSVLLPLLPPEYPSRVLVCNSPDPTAFRIDLDDAPAWEATAPRQGAAAGRDRENGCATLLPTGQVLVTGGWTGGSQAATDATATRQPELYTPGINWGAGDFSDAVNEKWETVNEPAPSRRGYHSTALLLPDGRVWTAGSTSTDEPLNRKIEIFEPAYATAAGRPVIDECPKNVGYDLGFPVRTAQAAQIARVVLTRCGSMTHGFNSDQRFVGLEFSVDQNTPNTLTIFPPPNGRVAPPGYYLLWLIDDQGRVCQRASFVRVSKQKIVVTADISTFSIHEVTAEGAGGTATFENALYVVADGFLPDEVSVPSHDLTLAGGGAAPGISVQFGAPKYEAGADKLDVAQRIIYPVHLTFTTMQAFNAIPVGDDAVSMTFTAMIGHHVGIVELKLSKNANPRMRDGDTSWLSIDVKVFKTNPTKSPTAGIAHPSGAGGAYAYIRSVVDAYRTWSVDHPGEPHPFDVPVDAESSRLQLAVNDVGGQPAFNYAIARVRLKAPVGVDAVDVAVFFRMWNTGWSSLEFDTNGSYRRNGTGPTATPLLGLEGGEVNNVPCFAEERKPDMEQQTDAHNRWTMRGDDDNEVFAYFGCWLDVNQNVKRFPQKPKDQNDNGPFAASDYADGLKSIQELMRGVHQCLVAEVHYSLDPVSAGATPGSSDNLAQRNILFDDSDNPGSFAAHLVHHTFEMKPSPVSFEIAEASAGKQSMTSMRAMRATVDRGRMHPDELVIDWGNLPRESLVTFYMPQVDAAEVVRYAGTRQSPGNLKLVGPGTVACRVSDVGFLPIPGPLDATIAGLVSVQLPPGVSVGETYRVVLRQVGARGGQTRNGMRVLGTTEFQIKVGIAKDLLPKQIHKLSVLRHVAKAIPAGNRWAPVFARYLAELEDRVRAFGGDPDSPEAAASPTGNGEDAEGHEHPSGDRPGSDTGRGCFTGRVRRVVYDCAGAFEGFELYDCDGSAAFRSCERGIERIVLHACERDLSVSVCRDRRTGRITRLAIECGCTADHAHTHDHPAHPH